MKYITKKLCSYLLIAVLILVHLPSVSAAPSHYHQVESERVNPFFSEVVESATSRTAPLYYSDGDTVFYTDPEEAASVIRDAMKARKSPITIGYMFRGELPDTVTQEWLDTIAFDLLLETAFAETENPAEGDSLRLGYRNVGVSARVSAEGNFVKLNLTYSPIYFTTAAQELELTDAVETLIKEFAFTEQTTEREKADTIYRWLCDNVTYDYTSSGYLKHSAYAALIQKSAVCQGYAALFYRLAEEVGLDARAITGVSSESGVPHGWNIVKLGDWYYYLDATWDAEKTPANYDYYLKGESDFYGHINDDMYDSNEFRTRYPVAPTGLTDLTGTNIRLGDWELTLARGDKAVITKYLGTDTHVVLPYSFKLTDYDMGSGSIYVESVASESFFQNTTMESLTIGEGVYRLEVGAINYCPALKELHLPSTLQMRSYGGSSFTEAPIDCDQLERVTVAEGNPYLTLVDGVLYTSDMSTALYCPPKNGLTTLSLPLGVVAVGNSAFASHDTLKRVILPSSVEQIGYWAFVSNPMLQEIQLNEGLVFIGQYALSTCENLETIHLPSTVETILNDAFYNTPLKTITVDKYNSTFWVENGILLESGKAHKFALDTEADTVVVPEIVIDIVGGAFEGGTFRNIVLPSTLRNIGNSAFSDCKNLVHITIPDGVTSIGATAFSGCDMLISAIVPATTTSLGDGLFHLGPPEKYVTVYGSNGSTAQTYCAENGIAFRNLSEFVCHNGHTVQQVADETLSTAYTDVWRFSCTVCGCHTRPFSKSYHSMGDADITYAVESTTHIYDGTRFTPAVLWVKKGDTLLTENVDYYVQYEDNLVPGGINALHLWGMGEYRGDRYVQLTIQRAPITEAVAVLSEYEFEYDGNPKQPWVQSLTLNGKTLTYGTDYVTNFTNNVNPGTGYVTVYGNGYYTSEIAISFTIKGHTHSWGAWGAINDTQHRRWCDNTSCAPEIAYHVYDNAHDEVCNDCNYVREVAHSFTKRYDSNEHSHWLVCDGCDKTANVSFGHYGGVATCQSLAVCVDCGRAYGSLGDCKWVLQKDDTQHWYQCECCNATKDYAEHTGGNGDCTTQKQCGVCGQAYGELKHHQWYYAGDTTYHWDACYFCTATQNKAQHQGGSATCGSLKVCEICQLAYGKPAGHSGGEATCTSQAFCQYCATPYGQLAAHTYSGKCDATCNGCGAKRAISHTYKKVITKATLTKNGKISNTCSVCGYTASTSTTIYRPYSFKLSATSYTYNGAVKTPSVTVKDAAGKTISSSNYTVTYATGRKNAGTYSVKITMKGNYSGTKTLTFKINPIDISKCSLKLSATSYTYNGAVKTPSVVVKNAGGTTLTKNTHYTVTYASGRKNAGTYTVKVAMKGNYGGSKTLSFKINPISISKCKLSLSTTTYTYDGKTKTPSVVVKNAGGTKLTKNTHYTVTYASGRKNVGTYKVTIKMKGNYSGTKTLTFKINPAKTTVSKVTPATKSLKVSITKKSTQVTGYQVQYSTSKTFKSVKTVNISSYKTTSTTIKSLKAKTTYYVRVRTYKTVGGVKYYSGWSTCKYAKTK